jgi:translation initiation factor 2B subunit (eIF-2B alpha/beta/delta family)
MCDTYREQEKEHRSDLIKSIATMTSFCILVVGGALYWLKLDLKDINQNSSEAVKEAKASIIETDRNIRDGFANVNRRITDNNNERIKNDDTLIWQLGQIQGSMGTIEWRIKQIEDRVPAKK